jgi:amino acid transporter
MASGRNGAAKSLRGKLNTFDITNLVVGSIIGADIYIATAIGSKLVGPASLIIWLVAGVIAIVIALSFAYCVMTLPKVGGPYAYVSDVSKPFAGFMVGWSVFFLGLSNSQMVDCLRSEYQACLPVFFQPKRIGSCRHW